MKNWDCCLSDQLFGKAKPKAEANRKLVDACRFGKKLDVA